MACQMVVDNNMSVEGLEDIQLRIGELELVQ